MKDFKPQIPLTSPSHSLGKNFEKRFLAAKRFSAEITKRFSAKMTKPFLSQVPGASTVRPRRVELLADIESDPLFVLQKHLPLHHRTVVRHLQLLVGTSLVRTVDHW